MSRKVVVLHAYYGCETGCCGHIIEIDDEEVLGSFDFEHPYERDPLEFAKEFVEKQLDADHVSDLDWENSFVIDD